MRAPARRARRGVARDGFALVLSLLLVLALAVMGAGMVALGAREAMIATQGQRIIQARLDAESAARVVAAGWSTRAWLDAVDRGAPAADLHPAPGLQVTASALQPGLILLRARTVATGGAGRRTTAAASAALLVHTLDPFALLAAFPAAIAVEGAGRVDAGVVSGEDACLQGQRLPALWGEAVQAGPGAMLAGGAPVDKPPPPMPAPDPLADPLLAGLADLRVEPGTLRPRPRIRDGRCDPAHDNWGALSAASPCHGLLPLIHAQGPLRLEAGEGRGILVVDGDLHLDGDFRFAGLVLVRGELSIAGEGRVDGLVRAARLVMHGGRVQHDACEAEAAASGPALDGAFRPARRWWIPSF